MSLEELMFLITPQRRINPATGQALPKRGPRGMETDFSVPGQVDPYAALLKRAGEIASRGATATGETLARPFTPNTWYGKQVINPDNTFGPKIYEYSPFQKIGAGAAGTGALVAGGVALDDAMHPKFNPASVPNRLPPEYGDVYEPVAAYKVPDHLPPEFGDAYERVSAVVPAAAPVARDTNREAAIKAMMQPRRPEATDNQPGGLARLFKDPYAGMSSRQMYEKAQDMGGDEYGANLMNIRAAKAEAEGLATGGAAKPHKDAALHKALDIISHMLGRH